MPGRQRQDFRETAAGSRPLVRWAGPAPDGQPDVGPDLKFPDGRQHHLALFRLNAAARAIWDRLDGSLGEEAGRCCD